MPKTILLTGATDGIGLVTAKLLVELGHTLLIHGRNAEKLRNTQSDLQQINDQASVTCYQADFSDLQDVATMTEQLLSDQQQLDVIINNAGVLSTNQNITTDGLDLRFVVNTLAPYVITQRLMPLLNSQSRVLNLSSAAQSPVNLAALIGQQTLPDMAAYAQSKLAITMWNNALAAQHGQQGPVFIAINPGSLLDTKMVQEAFGRTNGGADVGANILLRAALADEFADATGKYFDNDIGRFGAPHPHALDAAKIQPVMQAIENLTQAHTN